MHKKTTSLTIAAVLATAFSCSVTATDIGQIAPPFSLPTLQHEQPTSLSQFAGKVVYLDFWASWCAPCRTSFPLLNQLHQKLKAQGFEVIAINLDEDKANADKFLHEFPVNFTVLRDTQGTWADQYVVESMPTSFIIDKQGIVQHIHHGFTHDDIVGLEDKVSQLLAKK
jgi:thiol-disulfide isomerase/thioredoxin